MFRESIDPLVRVWGCDWKRYDVYLVMHCVLCGENRTDVLANVDAKDYWLCGSCGLVFLDPANRLSAEEEKARYETHQNNPEDPDYREFLSRVTNPLGKVLPKKAQGLDYGCGPGPTISAIMSEEGHEVKNYDPFFYPDKELLNSSYDFVTCTEVVEHLYSPLEEFETLDSLLRSNGWLGVMTLFFNKKTNFSDWYYRRDPTHVCFYQVKTMEWIAQRFGWKIEFPAINVVLFQKP